MRRGVLQRMMSRLLAYAVVSLAVPLVVSLVYDDGIWWAYLVPLLSAGALSIALSHMPAARAAPVESLRRREGFVVVLLGWLTVVSFTAAAYNFTGAFEGIAECFFESMSGYTTTGASILRNVEIVPRSILFQRAFSHWMGGMGIIVLSVAILPELAVGGLQLYSAETSAGLGADKLAPRIKAVARRLWGLYFTLTSAEAALLYLGGLSPFDAVTHAMASLATGGFSTKNASIAAFDSFYVEAVVMVFMILGATNFSLLYRASVRWQVRTLWRAPELRLFLGIMAVAILVVTLDNSLRGPFDGFVTALRHSAFQVVSVMTTTGFGTHDFDTWSDFSRILMVLLMLLGGCAGSTAGGSKVLRLYVVLKHAVVQLKRLVRPRIVQPLHIGEREIPADTTEAVLGFYLLYFAAFACGSLVMTALGLDMVSAVSGVAATMNGVGPGLGIVGAAEPFADVPDLGLFFLSFGMLLGRLEIYTVLVLFTPHFWRRG